MRSLLAFVLPVSCLVLAGVLPAGGAEPIAIERLELEVDGERERLLISAEAPLEPRVVEVDPRNLMVVLPDAVLGAAVPTQLSPVVRGTVERVTAFERTPGGPPEVRIAIQRRPGAAPELIREGSSVVLDFEARPRVREPVPAPSVRVAYRDAPLPRVVSDLARATDQTLIFDDTLRGSITIEGPEQVTPGEARALLDSLLLLRNFVAVPAPGGGRKIVPIAGAPSAWVPGGELPASDAPVTSLLRLESASAAEIVPAIRLLLGGTALVAAYPPTNSLVLSGPSSRLSRLRTVIQALDEVDPSTNVVWRLRYADAGDVADQVVEILGEDVVYAASGDERTNVLLLHLRKDAVERARALVQRLDRPAPESGVFQVVRLEHADPEAVAERLRALQASTAGAQSGLAVGLQGRDFAVVADRPTHSLVVRAAPEVFRTVLDVVNELDRELARVRVEVTIAQVTIDAGLALGFDWLLPGISDPRAIDDLIVGAASIKNGPVVGPRLPTQDAPFVASFTRSPILIGLIDSVGNPILDGNGNQILLPIPRESFALTLDGREVESEVLMRPQLVVVSGEEHQIFAGDNVPIRVAQTEEGLSLDTRQNIERRDVGTTLRVHPTIGKEGGVFLDLGIEASRLSGSAAGDAEIVGPSIREISVETKLWLGHDEVAVIAGAGEPQRQRIEIGAPWFKDIPILGFAFRRTEEREVRRYLLVSVEAEIMRPEREAFARALAEEFTRAAPEPQSAHLD